MELAVFGPDVVNARFADCQTAIKKERLVEICADSFPPKSDLTDESVLVDSSINFAIEPTTLLDREVLLRRSGGAAHRGPALLDDLARVCVPVLLALNPAARLVLAVEDGRVAFLASRGWLVVVFAPEDPVPEPHAALLPGRRYTESLGAFV